MPEHFGFPTHHMSPQAYRRLGRNLTTGEAVDLAADITVALALAGKVLTTAQQSVIFKVLRRGAE